MSTKVKYTLRKSRKMSTLMPVMFGILVGGIFISSTSVNASDIITTDNPATNAIEKQAPISDEIQKKYDKANQSEGQLNLSTPLQSLDKAVNDAQSIGISVHQDPLINHGTSSDMSTIQNTQKTISDDYQQQVNVIKKEMTDYQQQQTHYQQQIQEISKKNKDIKAQYAQEMTDYSTKKQQISNDNERAKINYQHALNNYHSEVDKIKQYNQQQNQQYEKDYQNFLHNKKNIIFQNQQQQQTYKQALQKYQQQLQQYNQKNQQYLSDIAQYKNDMKLITQKNEALLNNYQYDVKTSQQQHQKADQDNREALQKYNDKVNKAKKAILIGYNNPENINATNGENQQYSNSESWTNLKSTIIDNDVHIVASGTVNNVNDLQNGNYSIHVYSDTEGKITNDNIIKSIKWGDVDLVGNVQRGDQITKEYQEISGLDNALYDVMSGNTTKVFSVKSGEWFTVPQAIKLANNTTKDLLVKLTKSGTPLTYGSDWITVWNANGAINYYDGSQALIENKPADAISATYKVPNTNAKYLWTAATFDIDGGQYMTLHTKDSAIVSVGGGLKIKDHIISADEQLGYTWGKNKNINALDGTNSVPDGVMVFAEFANEISHTLANTEGGNSTSVANADFGMSINISVAEYPTLTSKVPLPKKPQLYLLPNKPQYPNQLTKPILPEPPKDKSLPQEIKKPMPKLLPHQPQLPLYHPLPKAPQSPQYHPLPKAPQSPQLHYHYHQLAIKPQINKYVTNDQNINIENKLIPKLSEVQWHLQTDRLPALREKISKYVLTDYLPNGFSLDLNTTQKLNPNFDLTFNHQRNILQLQATQNYLNYLNKDLTKEIMTISPKLIGSVLNDGATYINNFKLQLNNYHRYSNNVQVSTPGKQYDKYHPHNNLIKPIKYNANKNGDIINNKEVLNGATNYYHLIWDLDQYKNIEASKNDINKGFYFVDDYQEDILVPNSKAIIIQDNNQNKVQNINISTYSDLLQAPQNIQKILAQANIHPNGAFQLFSVNNPDEFYHQYVKQGKTLTIINPMITHYKKLSTDQEYINTAYQIDFGNGYVTEVIKNHIPSLKTTKDVVINMNDKHSMNNKNIKLNQDFYYHLIGATLPVNRANKLTEYSFIDRYDNTKDFYTKDYTMFTKVDLKLNDGTFIKSGDNVTKYTHQLIQDNMIYIKLNSAFLSNIDDNSLVKFEVFLKMKRHATGEVMNNFTNRINGNDVISNVVKTYTPNIIKENTKYKLTTNKYLPKTGESSSNITLIGLVLFCLTLFKLKKYN